MKAKLRYPLLFYSAMLSNRKIIFSINPSTWLFILNTKLVIQQILSAGIPEVKVLPLQNWLIGSTERYHKLTHVYHIIRNIVYCIDIDIISTLLTRGEKLITKDTSSIGWQMIGDI